jgi:hypothetical protein
MHLTKGQIAYLGNTLHEILHGFNVGDFYVAVGSSREVVERLSGKIEDNYIACRDENFRDLQFTGIELLILRNASLLCSQNLSRQEFHSRLGESPESARKFMRLLEPAEEVPALQP